MATFVLIHGAGDSGWYWHLVQAELVGRGHEVAAPDLPSHADGLEEYAEAALDAVGQRERVVVVGHSFGAFTAPLVAERLNAEALVLVAGMVPAPGEAPDDWWANTGFAAAAREQAERDGGQTGNDDPFVSFYHDVPRELAEEALRRERAGTLGKTDMPWPAAGWPRIRTRFVVCTEDRFFPPDFQRRLAVERLGIEPDEIAGGHCVALSRPRELAALLESYLS